MNTKLLTIITGLFLTITVNLFAADIKYNVAEIPRELKENARSVVRNHEVVLEVKSISKASVTITYAITILNKNGLDDADFQEYYGKFSRISGISGRVYDENGKQIKKIPSGDILDYSAISGAYEDHRVKYIDPKVRNFPFTVEYTYEESINGLFSYPSWTPQPQYNLAVEKSSYKAVVPKNLTFRYLEQNLPSKVQVTADSENNIYYWEAKGLKAKEWEPYSVSYQEIFPLMMAAPADFEIDGYQGNLTTWESFGKFIVTLNEGKNILDDATKKVVQDLVAGETDDREKVRKIYEYMQNRTRYVSIQIGIGGWQPFDAQTVHRLSYGDCKALSNYMKTLLEAVGIKSNYCLVNAGESASHMIREFPSSQFNHAFLCVPLKSDTLWLECTSQRMPCGFIGNFTDDRDVLLIDNEKCKVVHTKAYQMNDNMEKRKSRVTIDETGKGSVEMISVYKGVNYTPILHSCLLADDADKKRRISERMRFPGFQLLGFKYKENKAIIPSIEETVNVDFENYLTPSGPRLLLPLNFANRSSSPPSLRSRKTDVLVQRPSIDYDTIVYQLPSTLKPEGLPKPVSLKTKYGEYQAKVDYADNQLTYTRILQVNRGRYPAIEYADFVDFFDKVSVADGVQCSLVKK